ncbi:MAG: ABC transporter permease, partial [Cytophaga sp.]|nr:ABC transporter permease [Cytophaga sp.]
GNFFQSDFPEMLSLKMLSGRRDALKDPSSVLLSASAAKALFGDADPMNQSMRIDNKFDVKVAGVYEDLPYNTSFNDLKFMGSWELYITGEQWVKEAVTEWGNNSFQMFAQMAPGADANVVSGKIKKVKADRAESERQFFPEIHLNPMHNWHLYSEWKEGKITGGRIEMVWLFGIIGVFVLLLACINFMNLSTARSEKRAKEVGIRLAVGSVRSQLINQFLSESFIVVFIAYLLALGIVVLSLPSFNTMANKQIAVQWFNPMFWVISFSFIIVTSLLAGSYPALYLSSFQPVKVLKGAFRLGRFASLPRKLLVVIQFAVSVTLVIGTVIVYRQVEFTKSRPVGYDREGVIMMQMSTPDFYGKLDILRTELKNGGAIEEMSESSSPVTAIWSNNGGFNWPGKNPDLQASFNTIWVTPEYGKTLNWKIKEGRDFSREFTTDSSAIILNEAAVKFMGIKEPVVGMEVDWNGRKLNVVGLVEDLITQSPYNPVKQTIYIMDYNNVNWMNMKLNPEKSASESIALIESVFKKNITSAPFEYTFVDEDFAKKFSDEERIAKLTTVFAVLAVLISSLGIFGLASFVAEQRTKEIGVRKVLGASVANLWRMLSREFVILVVISCVIAIPVACYLLLQWLKGYEYHTDISWWIPVAATVGALVLTLATVSFQAVKAALMNPVKSLRSE